jgi:hypothetical protein
MVSKYVVLCFRGYMGVGTRESSTFERVLDKENIPHLLQSIPKPVVDAHGLRNTAEANQNGHSEYCTLGIILRDSEAQGVRGLLTGTGKKEDVDFILVPADRSDNLMAEYLGLWDEAMPQAVKNIAGRTRKRGFMGLLKKICVR